jgi:hypothetical protein
MVKAPGPNFEKSGCKIAPSFLGPVFDFAFRVITPNFEFMVRSPRARKNGIGRMGRSSPLVRKV